MTFVDFVMLVDLHLLAVWHSGIERRACSRKAASSMLSDHYVACGMTEPNYGLGCSQ